jgi:hypothetical protein
VHFVIAEQASMLSKLQAQLCAMQTALIDATQSNSERRAAAAATATSQAGETAQLQWRVDQLTTQLTMAADAHARERSDDERRWQRLRDEDAARERRRDMERADDRRREVDRTTARQEEKEARQVEAEAAAAREQRMQEYAESERRRAMRRRGGAGNGSTQQRQQRGGGGGDMSPLKRTAWAAYAKQTLPASTQSMNQSCVSINAKQLSVDIATAFLALSSPPTTMSLDDDAAAAFASTSVDENDDASSPAADVSSDVRAWLDKHLPVALSATLTTMCVSPDVRALVTKATVRRLVAQLSTSIDRVVK